MKTIKIPSTNNADMLSRRELFKLVIPRHQITPSVMSHLTCSGCGLCAVECPTEALTMKPERETDSLQLLFNYELCDACELCVDACPEKCLSLERELNQEKPAGAIILFRDKVVRCRECNIVIGTKSMIDKLEAKLKSANNAGSRHFRLCPTCKTKNLFPGSDTVSIDGKTG